MEARSLLVLRGVGDGKLGVRERAFAAAAERECLGRELAVGHCCSAACQAAGKNTNIIGEIGDRKRHLAQMVSSVTEGRNGAMIQP